MADQLEWRRGFPSRALHNVGWFLLAGAVIAAVTWLLFGAEPDRLPSGEPNPMVLVPPVTTVLAATVALPSLIATLRRPIVRANHYALVVRPGALRQLMLPWSEVAEVAGWLVAGEPLLLVRCADPAGRYGDRPRWFDQAVLRRANRRAIVAFDLAVRMDEFVGPPADRLDALDAWAPRHVRFVNGFAADELR